MKRAALLAGDRWRWVSPPSCSAFAMVLEMEHAHERVRLGDTHRRLRKRLPHVHFELANAIRATVAALHATWAEPHAPNLGSLGPQRKRFSRRRHSTQPSSWQYTNGETRDSVVDAIARPHCTNLYVAGGSVFASGGCANPTLNLVASRAVAVTAACVQSRDQSRAPPSEGGPNARVLLVQAGSQRRLAPLSNRTTVDSTLLDIRATAASVSPRSA